MPPAPRSCLIPLALWAVVSSGNVQGQSPVPRWERMEYGPFLQSSVTQPWSANGEDPKDITLRGLTVKFGTNGAATFDTGLLRWSAAWTGGWLKLMGTPFDGTHRPPEKSRPAVNGTVFLATTALPGVSPDGDWRDPRSEPFIPLPAERARYRGVHRRGDRIALEYSVGKTVIREVPGLESVGGQPALVRAMEIAPHPKPIELLAVENLLELRNRTAYVGIQPVASGSVVSFGNQTAGVAGLPPGATWRVETGTRLILVLPASKSPVRFHLVGARVTPEVMLSALDGLAAAVPDPATLLRNPGTAPEPTVTTVGRLGRSGGAYEVDLLTAPEETSSHSWMRFSGVDFFADGRRAAVCTWSGDVWEVSGLDATLGQLTWRRIASGLFQPQGLKIVKDRVYVLGRDQITRLSDTNGDGVADFLENFANGMSVTPNFHEFTLDLHTDPQGNFYFNKGGPLLGTDYWDPIGMHNGSVVRVSADGSHMERYATGLRAPNGLGVGPDGQVTAADNEGIWTPVCRLNWVRPGGFYGAVGMDHGAVDLPSRRAGGWEKSDFVPRYPDPRYDPPLCWLPFAIDNSSGSQVWTDPKRFGPLSGRLLHLSYGKCRAFDVLHEEVGGVRQGGVVPLPWTFDSSAMRGRVNPADGQLYVCGLKGWQTTAARDGALHRVRYTGATLPRLVGFHVRREGLELDFNEPLDPASALDLGNWDLQQWNYLWSHRYGSELYSVKDPSKVTGKKGELKGDTVPLRRVVVERGGTRLRLETGAATLPVMQLMVRARLQTATGIALPLEYYGTVNAVPR